MSYITIAKILPKGVREGYKNLLLYSGVRIPGERFLGFTVIFGLGLALAVAFPMMVFLELDANLAITIFLVTYGLFEGSIYMILWFRVDSRRRAVEIVLPDALQIMAMNIRSGLTTERALILTARPEFGILERELKKAGKEIMAGKDVKDALMAITKRVKSSQLETTLRMVVDGIDSGGELASLLEQTSADIQNTMLITKEVRASVLMYVIFIFFAIGIGAPLIFGISTYLVEVLTQQMSHFENVRLPDPEELGSGVSPFGGLSTTSIMSISSVSVDPEFLIIYAILSLLISSFFGGLIIGVIKDGEEKAGIKYFPVLLGMSLVIFFVTRYLAATVFAI